MYSDLATLLQQTIDTELLHLTGLSEDAAGVRPNGDKSWSPKQELGHLIDSAANNHQRFVRAALDAEYRGPGYAQDAWVEINGYQKTPWRTIVSTWYQYNCLLVRTIENVPRNKLATPCFIGPATEPVTLAFVIEDYVRHMRHHIDHLLHREYITEYPARAEKPSQTAPS